MFAQRSEEHNSREIRRLMPHQMENCCFSFLLSSCFSRLMTYFPGAVGVRDSCRLCDSGGNTKALLFLPSLHLLRGPYVPLGEVFRESADARCVFLPPPPPPPPSSSPILPLPSPLVPAWAQALNQSIGAPGTGEHSSVSVLPREAQPCLGRCICSPPGQEGEPRCPLTSWFHWKVSSPHLFLQGQRSTCFSLRGGAFGKILTRHATSGRVKPCGTRRRMSTV